MDSERLKTIEIKGKKIYLGKDKFFNDWGVVHPNKDENGKIVWSNLLFGGKKNLLTLLVILIVVGAGVYGYYETTRSCRQMAENPCDYYCCPKCHTLEEENNTLGNLRLIGNNLTIK